MSDTLTIEPRGQTVEVEEGQNVPEGCQRLITLVYGQRTKAELY